MAHVPKRYFNYSMNNDGGRDMLLTSKAVHKYRLITAKSVIDNAPPRSLSRRPKGLKLRSSKRSSNPDPSRMYSTLVKTTTKMTQKKNKRSRPKSADVRKRNSVQGRRSSRPRSSKPAFNLDFTDISQSNRGKRTKKPKRPASAYHMQPEASNTLQSIQDELGQLIDETPRTRFEMNHDEKEVFNQFVQLLTKYNDEDIDEILEGVRGYCREKKLLKKYGNGDQDESAQYDDSFHDSSYDDDAYQQAIQKQNEVFAQQYGYNQQDTHSPQSHQYEEDDEEDDDYEEERKKQIADDLAKLLGDSLDEESYQQATNSSNSPNSQGTHPHRSNKSANQIMNDYIDEI